MSTKNFGSFLKASRVKLGLTQDDVVSTFEISTARTKSAYSKYESGAFVDISPEMLRELCSVLKLDYSKAALRLMIDKYKPESQDIESCAGIEMARWDLMATIIERKSRLTDILDIDEGIATQLVANEIRAHAKALTNHLILDMRGLALFQKNLKGENNFWIASEHLFNENGDEFFSAMIEQLKQGSRYTFFIPEKLIPFAFTTLMRDLKKHLNIDADPEVQVIPIEENKVWESLRGNAYVIANPTSNKRQFGFMCTSNDHGSQLAHEIYDIRPLREYLGKLAINFAGQDSALMSHVTNQ